MQVRVFTLRFNSLLESFDDSELQAFLKDKEVLSIREHFFIRNEMPYLTIIVNFLPSDVMAETNAVVAARKGKKKSDESWREMIDEKDVPLFNTLRAWRNERSRREGIPPYVICTNRQLAEMINLHPQSLAKLGRVDKFGKVKLERYGKDILTFFSAEQADEKTATTTKAENIEQKTEKLDESRDITETENEENVEGKKSG